VSWLPSRRRALSTVIGVALLAAIVPLLSVATAIMLFGLVEEREPAPELAMSLEDHRVSIERRIVHEQGQQLDGDRVEVRGVADPETLSGTTLVGGDAESETKPVKLLSSEVSGDVASSDSVKLQDATVTGDVYVDGTFDCTNSTVNGQDCGAYSPKECDDH
jgi:FlaG/FlaF family flagellin (archaellin)